MSTLSELRIGVIGVGGRGSLAEYAHKPQQNVRVVGGADIDDEQLESFKEKFGPKVFLTNDYRRLLERGDIDAVFVTSPDFYHENQAVAALNAGKDVYLEKPMAITTAGCDNILKAAHENKRKLYLGHNMRHISFIKKMIELIDNGAIGEVKSVWCRHFISYGGDAFFRNWHAERRYTNSILLQKASHDIDIIHCFSNGYSQTVNAMGALMVYDKVKDRHAPGEKVDVAAHWDEAPWPPLSLKGLNPVIDVEDLSMMQMMMDNGTYGCYQQCNFTPDAWRNYTVIGTEGRIESFGDHPGECVVRLWNRRTTYNPYGDEQYFMPPEEGTSAGSDPKIVAEFLDYIRNDAKITTSAVAARNAVAAGCAATESLRNQNKAVNIEPLPKTLTDYFTNDEIRPIGS
ncbi:MAG: Gfo/Idh/MocA family oxidoreductase [Sedimentisphaerales bacterium]|nr:Gfo/Idh/MocA family oxidoreductase [Sedimentisphaerales bacterium]